MTITNSKGLNAKPNFTSKQRRPALPQLHYETFKSKMAFSFWGDLEVVNRELSMLCVNLSCEC